MNNEEKILEILTTLTKKVDKIETEHGKLLRTLDARSLKSAVLLETEIPHKLGLLFEGHKTILETPINDCVVPVFCQSSIFE